MAEFTNISAKQHDSAKDLQPGQSSAWHHGAGSNALVGALTAN